MSVTRTVSFTIKASRAVCALVGPPSGARGLPLPWFRSSTAFGRSAQSSSLSPPFAPTAASPGFKRSAFLPFLRGSSSVCCMTSSSSEMAPIPATSDASTAPPATPTSASRFKIYTKTGDKGTSSLYDGQRRRKDDDTFEALGDVDEVNSALGFAHEYCSQASISSTMEQIEEIQSRLLDIGSAIATPLNSGSASKVARVKFDGKAVETLEKWIDAMDEELPALSNFILPSGGLPAAALHLARSVCRRAERRVVTLVAADLVEPSVSIYLNRLSDYLFTAARYTAMKLNKPETIWRKSR